MGKIKVGAAKVCITPPPEFFPLVNGTKVTHKSGIHNINKSAAKLSDPIPVGVYMDLYTRIVVIDDGKSKFLFANLDAGPSFDDVFKNTIHERYGIPPENILGVWTHNHSSHIKWSRDPDTGISYRYFSILEKAVYEGIETAIARLQPARYGFGEGESYINVNRDKQFEDGHWMEGCNFAGPVDRTLAVMKFEDLSGNLIAAVSNYGCHPTCLRPELPDADGQRRIAPDFPGVASEVVEKRYGNDAVCLWTNGSSGDVNPVCTMGYLRNYELDGYNEPADPPYGFAYQNMMTLGYEHGIDTYRVLQSITNMKDTMEIKTTASVLNLPHQRYEGTDNFLDWAITDNIVRKRCPELLVNNRCPAKETRGKMVLDDGVSPLHMQVALFGDIAWVGVSGEPYCEIGMRMKRESPFKKTVIISHSHGDAMQNGGYLLSDNAKDHDTFTSYHTTTYPGGNDERITNRMLEMFDEILGLKSAK